MALLDNGEKVSVSTVYPKDVPLLVGVGSYEVKEVSVTDCIVDENSMKKRK